MYVGGTAVLFHTEGMSGFFLKISDKSKQLQIITIMIVNIEIHHFSASIRGGKKTRMIYFPTG